MFKLTLPVLSDKGAPPDRAAPPEPAPANIRALTLLVALAPAAYIGIAIWVYGVDVPVYDEWNLVVLFEKLARGTLTLGDLFAQQNEYRQFFPNLIFLAVGWLTKWDVRYEMFISLLLAGLVAYNVYRLGELTLPCARTARLCLFAAACLLIFSPAQYENWLQGQQLIFFLPAACLTTCLRLIYTDTLRPWTKLLLCAVLSTVATFSAPNGLLCWVLLPIVLARTASRARAPHRSAWLLLWLTGFIICLGLYFHGYQKPPHHPSLLHPFLHPLAALVYLLSLLGGPIGVGHLGPSVLAGALVLALYARALLQFKRVARVDEAEAGRMLGWLTLGAYALLTACLIMGGRVGFGLAQSLSSRYTTYTLFLPLALIYLSQYTADRSGRRRTRPAAATVLCVVLLLDAPSYLLSIRRMSTAHAMQLRAKTCVLLVNVVEADCSAYIYADPAQLRQRAGTLNQIGYLRPPLLRGRDPRAFAATDAHLPEAYGTFAQLARSGADEWTATGRAVLAGRGRPADTVLLACEGAGQEPVVFAVAETEGRRDLVSALLRRGADGDGRWRKAFSAHNLPAGADTITAWAFDANSGKAYRLAGAHALERE